MSDTSSPLDPRIAAIRQALTASSWVLLRHGTIVVFPTGSASPEEAVVRLADSIDMGPNVELGAMPTTGGAWLALGGDPDILTWITPEQLGGGPRDAVLIARYGDHLRRRDAETTEITWVEEA